MMTIKNLSDILKMNQMVLTMTCLKNILVFQYLVIWQNYYMKQKIKKKTLSFEIVEEILKFNREK